MRYRVFLFFGLLLVTAAPLHAEGPLEGSWEGWLSGAQGYEEAIRDLERTRSPVALYIRAEGCDECEAFEKHILASPEAQEYFKDVLKVRVNFNAGPEEQAVVEEYRYTAGTPAFHVIGLFEGLSASSKFSVRISTGGSPTQFIEACQEAGLGPRVFETVERLPVPSRDFLSNEEPLWKKYSRSPMEWLPLGEMAEALLRGPDAVGKAHLQDLRNRVVLQLVVIGLVYYLYYALTLFLIAGKTDTPHRWMAWFFPLSLHVWVKAAKLPGWWLGIILALSLFLDAVPYLALLPSIYVDYRIYKERDKPVWIWAVLSAILVSYHAGLTSFIPYGYLVHPLSWGYLAFSGGAKKESAPPRPGLEPPLPFQPTPQAPPAP